MRVARKSIHSLQLARETIRRQQAEAMLAAHVLGKEPPSEAVEAYVGLLESLDILEANHADRGGLYEIWDETYTSSLVLWRIAWGDLLPSD